MEPAQKETEMLHFKTTAITAALGLSLAGCATNPDGTVNWSTSVTQYTQAAQATAAAAKQIGQDLVQVDCSAANIVYVIAQSVAAQSRVTAALKTNSDLAQKLCPLLTGNPAIVVQTGSVVGQ